MAYKTIRTFTRPNASVPFFVFGDAINNYVNATYNQTGKRTSLSIVESELTQTTTSIWIDESAYNTFMSDQHVVGHRQYVDAHNLEFGITTTWEYLEE
jgi:hypothetical protein